MDLPSILLPDRRLLAKPWGGSTLARWLKVRGTDLGESWELYDLGSESSGFRNVPAALHELVRRERPQLLGRAAPGPAGRFPLTVKLLDAADRLSLQVHPDRAAAAAMNLRGGGKSEAWVVLRADAGASLVHGLADGVGAEDLFHALERNGEIEPLLRFVAVEAGDVIDVPAGTLHSVGPGVVLYEIQESSDSTLRLHDWGRVDASGRPRELHVEAGRQALRRPASGPGPKVPAYVEADGVERLISNHAFELRRVRGVVDREIPANGRCHVLTVTRGRTAVSAGADSVRLAEGGTCVVPASAGEFRLEPSGDSAFEVLWAQPHTL